MSAILYWVFCRSIDVAAETRLAEREAEELEEEARHHTRPHIDAERI